MPQTYPNHIFKGLNSKLGQRVRCILKHLFPVPKDDSKRVVTWYEEDDVICFRLECLLYMNFILTCHLLFGELFRRHLSVKLLCFS